MASKIARKCNNYISINTLVHVYVIMIKVSLNCIFPVKILKPPSPDLRGCQHDSLLSVVCQNKVKGMTPAKNS